MRKRSFRFRAILMLRIAIQSAKPHLPPSHLVEVEVKVDTVLPLLWPLLERRYKYTASSQNAVPLRRMHSVPDRWPAWRHDLTHFGHLIGIRARRLVGVRRRLLRRHGLSPLPGKNGSTSCTRAVRAERRPYGHAHDEPRSTPSCQFWESWITNT
ncbi:uncharacterized protein C8Q71DRAFT_580701 [Rhodofomes roseus]|uniref:Secreted protein n=1 Tax=Rhodofomes roseus TaxID=34475 RepID=A0ABQ8KGR3_9APHY|nr:uncharacterized protein C8Q71DRAFT_580701 [Rhodofomes roseus]KAH9836992.1 hypothetical protein C8Q71DRAFT_580701 [Rhodofomes roseus]